jgi:hypothetical protein
LCWIPPWISRFWAWTRVRQAHHAIRNADPGERRVERDLARIVRALQVLQAEELEAALDAVVALGPGERLVQFDVLVDVVLKPLRGASQRELIGEAEHRESRCPSLDEVAAEVVQRPVVHGKLLALEAFVAEAHVTQIGWA